MTPEQAAVVTALTSRHGESESLPLAVPDVYTVGGEPIYNHVILARGISVTERQRGGPSHRHPEVWWYVPDRPTSTSLRHATDDEVEAAQEQNAARDILTRAGLGATVTARPCPRDGHSHGAECDGCTCAPTEQSP